MLKSILQNETFITARYIDAKQKMTHLVMKRTLQPSLQTTEGGSSCESEGSNKPHVTPTSEEASVSSSCCLSFPPSLHLFFYAKQAGEAVWGLGRLKQKHSDIEGAGVWRQGGSEQERAPRGKETKENTKRVGISSSLHMHTHTLNT